MESASASADVDVDWPSLLPLKKRSKATRATAVSDPVDPVFDAAPAESSFAMADKRRSACVSIAVLPQPAGPLSRRGRSELKLRRTTS